MLYVKIESSCANKVPKKNKNYTYVICVVFQIPMMMT